MKLGREIKFVNGLRFLGITLKNNRNIRKGETKIKLNLKLNVSRSYNIKFRTKHCKESLSESVLLNLYNLFPDNNLR